MNYALLKEIIKHIYAHFAIVPSDFVNLKNTDSLMNPIYLLPEKIIFEIENTEYQGKVWGCQLSAAQNEVKVLLGDCTYDDNFHEFTMIVQAKDSPTYGMYLIHNELFSKPKDSQPMLAVSLDGKNWMQCNSYLQGTFLAAMEQLRDMHLSWSKCSDYNDLYKSTLSFLQFHSAHYGE